MLCTEGQLRWRAGSLRDVVFAATSRPEKLVCEGSTNSESGICARGSLAGAGRAALQCKAGLAWAVGGAVVCWCWVWTIRGKPLRLSPLPESGNLADIISLQVVGSVELSDIVWRLLQLAASYLHIRMWALYCTAGSLQYEMMDVNASSWAPYVRVLRFLTTWTNVSEDRTIFTSWAYIRGTEGHPKRIGVGTGGSVAPGRWSCLPEARGASDRSWWAFFVVAVITQAMLTLVHEVLRQFAAPFFGPLTEEQARGASTAVGGVDMRGWDSDMSWDVATCLIVAAAYAVLCSFLDAVIDSVCSEVLALGNRSKYVAVTLARVLLLPCMSLQLAWWVTNLIHQTFI
eukprot:TRINITY_DN1939_c0_g1_i4.p1 TRINITY_DN1939_c0_g1~~TRINITY_DN1939_c0_g1_i4.p1  ORF type:complete len:344 (+),score=13.90 TRINITY_DN1939_c0_g1_i4:159-1190(+)